MRRMALGVLAAAFAATALVPTAQALEGRRGDGTTSDFNGDGFGDLAIGVPSEDIGGPVYGAGVVNVLYGSIAGLLPTGIPDQVWTQNTSGVAETAEDGDGFGSALATADFNGDGYGDLAIGTPEEDLDVGGEGVVQILYGTRNGLATIIPDQLWSQDSAGIKDTADVDDGFGSALSSGDFDGDGYDDLAVGVPYEGNTLAYGFGATNVLYGSSSGLTDTGDQFWSQDTADVSGVIEDGDWFAWALAAGDFNGDGRDDLGIGVRYEDFGTAINGGGANVLYGSSAGLSATVVPDQFWYQDTTDVNGVAENYDEFGSALAAGDANGDGRDDLAIGVPRENEATAIDSGGVNLIYGSASGLSATTVPDQYWSQDSGGVEDACETDDHFGSALAFGRFTPDAWADLAVGVDGESLSFAAYAGSVNVLYGSSQGLSATGDQFWNQDSPDVEEGTREDDRFGYALSTGDFNQDGKDDLAIGSPFESYPYWYVDDHNYGAVSVLHGYPGGLTATGSPGDQYWYQDSPNVDGQAENGDWFGWAVAAAG